VLSCVLALAEPALAQEPSPKPKPPPPGAACGKLEGTQVLNTLLTELTPPLNTAWPSLAVKVKIDPLQDALPDFNIPCKYGGDELCGMQASQCDMVTASFDHSTVNGLAYLQYSDLVAASLSGTSGTQACPFNPKASGGAYACSYAGAGSGSGNLVGNSKVSVTLSKLKIKVKCKVPVVGKTFKEEVFSGKATCEAKAKATTGYKFCGGSCAAGDKKGTLSYFGLSDLDVKISSVDCDISPKSNPLSWVGEALASPLKDKLEGPISSAISKGLNSWIAENLPFPGKCGT
jgi:hypothetical protein